MNTPYAYIECAGTRVPADWTSDKLRTALAKRNIRFTNEEEIMAVFGNAIQLKASLETAISHLRDEIATLNEQVIARRELAKCPGCGKLWYEKPKVKSAKPKS